MPHNRLTVEGNGAAGMQMKDSGLATGDRYAHINLQQQFINGKRSETNYDWATRQPNRGGNQPPDAGIDMEQARYFNDQLDKVIAVGGDGTGDKGQANVPGMPQR